MDKQASAEQERLGKNQIEQKIIFLRSHASATTNDVAVEERSACVHNNTPSQLLSEERVREKRYEPEEWTQKKMIIAATLMG